MNPLLPRAYLHAQVWGGEVEPGPEADVELARARVAEGFSTIKFDPFWFAGSTDATISRQELRRVVAIVGAVRRAIGDDVEMGIEFHAKFNTPAAIRIGLALEEFDPFFLEEPIGSEDLDALRLVAAFGDVARNSRLWCGPRTPSRLPSQDVDPARHGWQRVRAQMKSARGLAPAGDFEVLAPRGGLESRPGRD